MREPLPDYKMLEYDPQTVQNSLQSVLNRFCTNGGSGREDYVWSLYDTLGIPEGSIIEDNSMNELVKYIVRPETPLQCPSIPTRFWSISTPYLFISDARVNILHIPRGDGTVIVRQHELHVEDNGTILPVQDIYKLHISVKHKYILYTVLKLAAFRATIQDIRPFQMKCLFNSRYSEISAENTGLLNLAGNGGSVPPIVLYMNQNPANLYRIFQGANSLFSEEDRQTMGLMTTDYPLRIPPLNIRLNEMFAYALGDRNQKLSLYEKDAYEGKESACRLPGWLLADMAHCDTPAIRDALQTQFGRPVCDRVVEGVFQKYYKDGTADPLCYLSLSAHDMVRPNTLLVKRGGKRRLQRTRRLQKQNQKQRTYRRTKKSATV